MKARLLAGALGASLLLMSAGAVVAQTPAPVERTAEMEERAAELASRFPDMLGGVSLLDELEVEVGQELLADYDVSDPDDVAEIDEITGIVTAAGATLDDAATVVSLARLDESTFGFIAAFSIRGTDAQQTLPLFLDSFRADIDDPIVEDGQVGDVAVTMLRSGADPDGQPFVLLPLGDAIWVLSVPVEFLEEAVGSLTTP